MLQSEVDVEVQGARNFIAEVLGRFPDISRAIKTRKAARILLAKERSLILHLGHEGVIDENEEEVGATRPPRQRFAAVPHALWRRPRRSA